MKYFQIEFQPTLPAGLTALDELANDLYYSWNAEARILFRRLDEDLWEKCNHNPKLFLRRVAQEKLDDAVNDSNYMEQYARVLSSYNAYRTIEIYPGIADSLDTQNDLIAYLCLEFGFHESLPIYSGGLGILAGDLCKAASDMAIPFVGIGLLYRQGYFNQQIDSHGNQIAIYNPTEFDHLPVTPCTTESGKQLNITIDLPDRNIVIKIWKAIAGNISLYFLDSDIAENSPEDRKITHQLYGGDKENRILQEIILGVGGVRALRALGLSPTIWHLNEGHAAFSTLERCRENVEKGMAFEPALELNATNVVFTTHTPVPAGHDIFDKDLVHKYFSNFTQQLNIGFDDFMALGTDSLPEIFNMTVLGLKSSRHHNGVSQIHGGVASDMEAYLWPQIPSHENPIGYVTNGVHVSTFLAREWIHLLDMRFGDWRRELNNEAFWDCLDDIPGHRFWSLRRELKTSLFREVYRRVIQQYQRNGQCQGNINLATALIQQPENDVLVLGFARRFATYKRANLIFYDIARLQRLLNDPERPTLLLFAGKAHPKDGPGQDLVRHIYEISQRPEFIGKIILVEDYDMVLARRLVAGVDVWINTPEYPMEASGTSGQKAGMNGVLNLSVLDGWWHEGYNNVNGWGIKPHGGQFEHDFRNHQESSELLDILEYQVIPTYYDRNGKGYSAKWVELATNAMKSIIPNFNSQRMLSDYINQYYLPAIQQYDAVSANDNEKVINLSAWKNMVKQAWPGVSMQCVSQKPSFITQGESFTVEVNVNLNGLSENDVVVECLLGDNKEEVDNTACHAYKFSVSNTSNPAAFVFSLELDLKLSGLKYMRIRMYPYHENLSHRFETGCMLWLQE